MHEYVKKRRTPSWYIITSWNGKSMRTYNTERLSFEAAMMSLRTERLSLHLARVGLTIGLRCAYGAILEVCAKVKLKTCRCAPASFSKQESFGTSGLVSQPHFRRFLKTTTTSLKLCRKNFIKVKSLCPRALRSCDVSVGISRER